MRTDPVAVGAAAPTGVGDVLIASRSFREYRSMVALDDADLRGRVLDYPRRGRPVASAFQLGAAELLEASRTQSLRATAASAP